MRWFRRLAPVAASSLFFAGAAVLPAPGDAAGEQHCVIHVLGKRPNGQFETGPEACYTNFADALASVSIDVADDFDPADLTDAQLIGDWAIGTHYDGFNGGGSSLTVMGADCTGGWLNLSSTWVNKISSTKNGCNRIRHFDGYDLSGTYEDTSGAGTTDNLTTLNNAANSIQYVS